VRRLDEVTIMAARTAHHRSRSLLVLVLSLMMPACYAHDPATHATPVRFGVGDVVTGAELVASGGSSLYDALARTRGNFFRARGLSSLTQPPSDAILVFRDGAIMGTITTLTMLRPSDVRSVRRISATETYRRYGRNVSVAGFEVELLNDR
jgi:hypothetical protein